MEHDGVTLVEIGSVGRRPAVGHRAAGLNERRLTKTKVHVLVTVKTRPVKDSFRLIWEISCFILNLILS